MLSLSTPGAAALLHVVPTKRACVIPDGVMRAAIRMRIGASPINNIPTCCADCGQPLERGVHCIGGCNSITASLGRQRHDMVVNALNSILRADAGVNTVLEPANGARPSG